MEVTSHLGQDLDLGNRCSRLAFNWAKRSFPVRGELEGQVVLTESGSFANLLQFGNVRIGITSDGIGTKIEVAERCGRYDTLGFDLVAMVADDLIANGIEPTGISNILDVDRLCETTVDALMGGLYGAALAARMAVTGGEIAELGGRIGGYGDGMHFNWCATAVGYFPEGRESLTGLQIAAGDVVLALRSPGLRSNGFSLARQILARRLGDSWHAVAGPEGKTWGEILLTPSLIYAPHLYDLLKSGVDVHGFAHVTGGGIPDNLGRILRASGCGATIGDTLPPEDFFLVLQEWGGIPDRLLYHSWNMNHGMLVILPEAALNGASRFLADAGFDSRAIGRITSSPGIVIASRGREGGEIRYERSGK